MTYTTARPKGIPTAANTGRILLQPTASDGRREYECVFIQAGRVKQADQEQSNWLIPAATIQAAVSLFNAVPSYLDHPEAFGFGWRQEPRVANLVGVTFSPRWDEEQGALLGGLRLYDRDSGSPGAFVGALLDQMLEDKAQGREVPHTGLSAVFFQDSTFDEDAGLRVTTAFRYVESVDVVYDPGAGGYVRAALAAIGRPNYKYWHINWEESAQYRDAEQLMALSNQTVGHASSVTPQAQQGATMPNDTNTKPELTPIDEALAAIDRISKQVESLSIQVSSILPPQGQSYVQQGGEDTQALHKTEESELAKLAAKVQTLEQQLQTQEEKATITGMGAPRVQMGRTSVDQLEAAVEAMIGGVAPPAGIAPLSGMRELYHLLSGDYEMTGLYHADRVYLANVNSSTMAGLVANALNKRVANMFQMYPMWWDPIVIYDNFTSLQDVRWITLGGLGELPTVAEGSAYTELTWDDQTEVESFVKKGGYLGLTLEAIDKDDTARIRSAPRALAQAAWLTLSKSISSIFTANAGVGPTLDTDSLALFHASHSNLRTVALSWAEYVTVRTAMRKQTELNSGERLGSLTSPRFLLVPPDLEITALQILASEGEPGTADNDANPLANGNNLDARMNAARNRVVVVDLWTDTNNWAAVADPMLYPCIGVGYRYGRMPEIFSVASPTAGLMFTNDTLPIKVRYFYAAGVIDYRGLHKNNVA